MSKLHIIPTRDFTKITYIQGGSKDKSLNHHKTDFSKVRIKTIKEAHNLKWN